LGTGQASGVREALAGGGGLDAAPILALVELDLRVNLVAVLVVVARGGLDEPEGNLQVGSRFLDRSVVVADRGDHLPDVQTRADQARAAAGGSIHEPD